MGRHCHVETRSNLNESAFGLNADGHICKSLIARLISR